MPIIYAGFAGIGYGIYYNNKQYQEFRYAYRLRQDTVSNNDTYPEQPTETLRLRRDTWHRYRDLTIVGGLVLYTLQVVDATVDAHLFSFDVSEDLSLHWEPRPYMGMVGGRPVRGACFVLSF